MDKKLAERLLLLAAAGIVLIVGAAWYYILAKPARPGDLDGGGAELERLRAQQAELPPAKKVKELLGDAPFGKLALRLYRGEGRRALTGLGFEPDRQERYASRLDMGEFAQFAPRGIDKHGWSGTALIEGRFDHGAGCLLFELDDGTAVWIHATAGWLEQHLPENPDFPYSLGEQFRHYSHTAQMEAGEVEGGFTTAHWFQMDLDAKAITVRLSQDSRFTNNPWEDRYDFFLCRQRADELREQSGD